MSNPNFIDHIKISVNQEMEEEVHLVFEEKNLFLKVDQMEVMVEKEEILF